MNATITQTVTIEISNINQAKSAEVTFYCPPSDQNFGGIAREWVGPNRLADRLAELQNAGAIILEVIGREETGLQNGMPTASTITVAQAVA
jgi:hypothetical protein